MRSLTASALFVSALTLTAQTAKTPSAVIKSAASKPPSSEKSNALPVTRIALYKNGVGFFEHSGSVTGNQTVTIDFTTAQLNDVLQSLTAIDLNGGRITGAGYNSATPLGQQLKSLPLALSEDPSATDLYSAIRGAHVEVAGSGSAFSGRILNIEIRSVPGPTENSPAAEKRFLTVISDSGAIRSLELTPSTQVRLLDSSLHSDLSRYLELIAANRSEGLRHLSLRDNGTGTRQLRVSYISEVPIWKSTYRILLTDSPSGTTPSTATLQGWAVVDNTVGTDWNNVQLSLIAGSPQSFIQPLSQPIYSRRPDIPIAQDAQLTPQTHESSIESAKAAPQMAGVAGMSGMGAGSGVGSGNGFALKSRNPQRISSGVMGGIGNTNETVAVAAEPMVAYESAAADSITPNTTTSAYDDYFEYKLSDPVTIRKNESALVPILQSKLPVERVSLWSPTQPRPLRALWITNSSNLTLDRGSFSIVENGNFGGEGLLDPIHPSERRLLSYAADQAIRVTTDYSHDTQRILSFSIVKGVLRQQTSEVSEVEYIVHNSAPDPRTVIVEQPKRSGWKLDSDPQPAETTPDAYRFRVATAAGESVRLHIGQRRDFELHFRLVNTTDEQLTLILRNANPTVLQQLEPVFAAKRALASLDNQIKARQADINQITEDQKRIRENLSTLKGSSEERSLAKRYTDELNQQEDKLAALRKELDTLHQQRDAAQQDLDNKIESLNIGQIRS
ncbi:DUF4139 domain-containing protein [Edaphobacter albus]|uniref:DUF4139 domain-containing protein n=1 Tax=Edaphobacter sp. 4G125 TaxID=2763071 RepID=UPI001647ED8E|nr:DUF4139 domain-containing protein [Edaphobacter sp. 4G125]QNI38058.1 DUF4139 domain-containing protein [Edaphobacter sp. 4G125]